MKKTVTVENVTFGEGQPKIIVPIVGNTDEEILSAAKQIKDLDCDVVEWRIDHYNAVTTPEVVAKFSAEVKATIEKPLLVTFRTHKEGGVFEMSDSDYFTLYQTLIENGTLDLLDVELFMPKEEVATLIEKAHEKSIKVIMCNHDFDKTPSQEEIVNRLVMMSECGADICKIAVMPQSNNDVLTLLAATAEANDRVDNPLITMSMGALGMVSRVSGEVFGSTATFGAAQAASAPGQVPVSELRTILATLKLR